MVWDHIPGPSFIVALDKATGKELWRTTRDEMDTYVTGRDGVTMVLKHGPTYEVLAENVLDDGFDASPALVGSEIYLRGFRYLYRISE